MISIAAELLSGRFQARVLPVVRRRFSILDQDYSLLDLYQAVHLGVLVLHFFGRNSISIKDGSLVLGPKFRTVAEIAGKCGMTRVYHDLENHFTDREIYEPLLGVVDWIVTGDGQKAVSIERTDTACSKEPSKLVPVPVQEVPKLPPSQNESLPASMKSFNAFWEYIVNGPSAAHLTVAADSKVYDGWCRRAPASFVYPKRQPEPWLVIGMIIKLISMKIESIDFNLCEKDLRAIAEIEEKMWEFPCNQLSPI